MGIPSTIQLWLCKCWAALLLWIFWKIRPGLFLLWCLNCRVDQAEVRSVSEHREEDLYCQKVSTQTLKLGCAQETLKKANSREDGNETRRTFRHTQIRLLRTWPPWPFCNPQNHLVTKENVHSVHFSHAWPTLDVSDQSSKTAFPGVLWATRSSTTCQLEMKCQTESGRWLLWESIRAFLLTSRLLWMQHFEGARNVNILVWAVPLTTLRFITALSDVKCSLLSWIEELDDRTMTAMQNIFRICLISLLDDSPVLRLGQCSNDAIFDVILGQMLNFADFTPKSFDQQVLSLISRIFLLKCLGVYLLVLVCFGRQNPGQSIPTPLEFLFLAPGPHHGVARHRLLGCLFAKCWPPNLHWALLLVPHVATDPGCTAADLHGYLSCSLGVQYWNDLKWSNDLDDWGYPDFFRKPPVQINWVKTCQALVSLVLWFKQNLSGLVTSQCSANFSEVWQWPTWRLPML